MWRCDWFLRRRAILLKRFSMASSIWPSSATLFAIVRFAIPPEDDVLVVVPRRHRLAVKHFVTPEDFAAENVLVYPPQSESTLLTKILEPAGIRPRRIQEVLLTEVILEMIIGGLGIAALPRWAVGPQVASGAVIGVPLEPPGYRWHWSVAQLRDNSPPDYLQEFVRIIADRPTLADFFPRTSGPRSQAGQGRLPRHAAAQPASERVARSSRKRR